jgi:hypothetical protein
VSRQNPRQCRKRPPVRPVCHCPWSWMVVVDGRVLKLKLVVRRQKWRQQLLYNHIWQKSGDHALNRNRPLHRLGQSLGLGMATVSFLWKAFESFWVSWNRFLEHGFRRLLRRYRLPTLLMSFPKELLVYRSQHLPTPCSVNNCCKIKIVMTQVPLVLSVQLDWLLGYR